MRLVTVVTCVVHGVVALVSAVATGVPLTSTSRDDGFGGFGGGSGGSDGDALRGGWGVGGGWGGGGWGGGGASVEAVAAVACATAS